MLMMQAAEQAEGWRDRIEFVWAALKEPVDNPILGILGILLCVLWLLKRREHRRAPPSGAAAALEARYKTGEISYHTYIKLRERPKGGP